MAQHYYQHTEGLLSLLVMNDGMRTRFMYSVTMGAWFLSEIWHQCEQVFMYRTYNGINISCILHQLLGSC